MACPRHGPCEPFADELDLCCLAPSGLFPDPCLTTGEPLPAGAVDNALQAASEILWAATGRRYGRCEVKIRPCRNCPCPDYGFTYGFGFPWYPYLMDGLWYNCPCPTCVGDCGCTHLEEIDIPYPTCEIVEVKIDGDVVPPTGYRVDEFRKLVRIDGGSWPTCQDLEKDDTEDGTFSVTLIYGREVPELLKQATAAMACELLKSCVGAPCILPQRISTLTRQGVTAAFIDSMDFLASGRTGIYIVDLAIQTFNPHGITRRPAIWSPDAGPRWRITDT